MESLDVIVFAKSGKLKSNVDYQLVESQETHANEDAYNLMI